MWLLRCILCIVAFVGITHTIQSSQPIIATFIYRQQEDSAVAAWVNEYLPADATLYTFGLTLTLQHETSFTIHDIFFETPASLDEKWTRGQDDYLLLNVWVINQQWEGREPHTAYQWFLEERGVTRIQRKGNYSLFLVHAG